VIDYEVGEVVGDEDFEALTGILAQSFRVAVDKMRENARLMERELLRVVRCDGRVVGGLKLIPMGQWFGGRSVPMTGIAAVGIDPAFRGRGAGSALMRETMRELAAQGVALSTLYPATVPIYRGAGFELAGSRFKARLPLAGLSARAAGLPMREGLPADFPAMDAAYRRFARERNGLLDRGDYIWNRLRYPQGEAAKHYMFGADEEPEGYLSFTQAPASDGFYELKVTDVVANTEAAAKGLLAFFGAHQSMATVAHLQASANHPMLLAQPDWRAEVSLHLNWMLRVVRVDKALEARGYGAGIGAELHLEVVDDVVPGNAERWVLHVADGRGRVEAGGEGRLKLDVRALAALYSGHQTPDALHGRGMLQASEDERALTRSVFAGSAPWMPSIF
jgi:predicted acetyltransferase